MSLDLVYVLGSGSIHKNIELRYSLKSVERFMTGYRNIYVVGEHPGFEGNFIHIPYPDEGRNKQDNIKRKLVAACQHPDISESFVMMNDDYFLLKEVDASQMPFYYHGNVAMAFRRKRKQGHYKRALQNTINELSFRDLPLRYFDVHAPMIINKYRFLEIINSFNWNERDGYVIKSVYANSLKIEGTPYDDCNVNIVCESRPQIVEMIGSRFMFSIGDSGLNEPMLAFLAELYSDVSESIDN